MREEGQRNAADDRFSPAAKGVEMNRERCKKAYERAVRYLPGGVNSPVRAFRAVGGDPLFVERGQGAWIEDVDGNRYVDFCCSWGPLILGHADPRVVEAVQRRAATGTSFGIPTELETALAERVVRSVPSVDRVRFVSSGTEATMSALRLARGHTGRDKVVKFAGCYHGHSDAFLVKAGSGAATFGSPDSPGVPAAVTRDTLVLPFNDLKAVEHLMERVGDEVAAVLLEPVAGNMGVVPPKPGFLEGLRELTRAAGALLIFDEVITGFRLGMGGAQEHYGVVPDMSCLGKVLGGGLPLGAFGGRADIMEKLSPEGPVYQAGTLSGNPLAVQAGLTTLERIGEPGFFEALNEKASGFVDALRGVAADAGRPFQIQSVGSMFTLFFLGEPAVDFETAGRCDRDLFARFHRAVLSRGVYWPPSALEACFVSAAHGEDELEHTLDAVRQALASLAD